MHHLLERCGIFHSFSFVGHWSGRIAWETYIQIIDDRVNFWHSNGHRHDMMSSLLLSTRCTRFLDPRHRTVTKDTEELGDSTSNPSLRLPASPAALTSPEFPRLTVNSLLEKPSAESHEKPTRVLADPV